MKRFNLALVCAGALFTGACDKSGEDAILAPVVPTASTRFFAAASDTTATDWRFVDQIEYSPTMIQMAFRGFSPYQPTAPGPRHFRLFTSYPTDFFAANPNTTALSTPMLDTTLTFTANAHYTMAYAGRARAGGTPAAKFFLYTDDFTDPGTSISLRVINLDNDLATVDVYTSTTACAAPLGTPLVAGMAFGAASAYTVRAVGAFNVCFTAAGSATVLANVAAPVGAAGDKLNDLTALGGSSQASSVMAAFLLPRAAAGSPAVISTGTSANITPTIFFLIDKNPPRGF